MTTSASNSQRSHMQVVVIDDDTMVLHSLEMTLADFGFSVTGFDKPLEALEWMAKNRTDIVISDIRMPKCDGFKVLKRVKEIDPHCSVIFITAHGQMDIAIRALREGATDFFEKPFTTSALSAAIERTQRFRVLSQQKSLLSDQVHVLSREISTQKNNRNVMLGQSDVMKNIAKQIIDVSASMATVLISGESGTGKELVADAIHTSSSRKDNPFLTVNCPSIPVELFESEVFGHRRGSFTGAVETRGGYIEAARGGTLFLDEIGDLPLKSQAKILRLLEQRTYLPVGENEEVDADVRILAATNQSLEKLVEKKTFREDLYYRLRVCEIDVPPLRDRKEDIPLIALYFSLRFAHEMGKPIEGLDNDALQVLSAWDYPGNVRELRNAIESSIIHCQHPGLLTKDDLPHFLNRAPAKTESEGWPIETLNFKDVEKRLYEEALRRTDRNVSAAARLLNLSRGKLRRRLSALDIQSN